MEKAKTTPKDFFLWAGAMVSLYAGVVSFIGLIFDYINYVFPDTALNYYVDPYQGSVSYEMASLIVLAPVFLILMRLIRRDMEADASRRDIWVRRWALFLTLFVAGASIVIDLIVLINTFLQGEELSVRFLLKVAIVLLVSAAGFMHFVADLWGYWVKNPHYARRVSWGVAALIILTILSGFVIIGSPQSQRKLRLDTQRVENLQSIQSQIVYIWQQKESLPADLSELNDSLSYFTVPVDPVTGASYVYKRQSPLDFTLCATFDRENYSSISSAPISPRGVVDKWQHGAGEVCFDRSIDPKLYPPFKSPQS